MAGSPESGINTNVQSRHIDSTTGLQYLSKIYADLHRVSQNGLAITQLCPKSDIKNSNVSGQPGTFAAQSDEPRFLNVSEASPIGAEIEEVYEMIEKAKHFADSAGYYMTLNLEDIKLYPRCISNNDLLDLPSGCFETSQDSIDREYLKRRRIFSFACRHGWMMLSILVHSRSFRVACHTFDENLWKGINVAVQNNLHSLAMFAQVRGIDWKEAMTHHIRRLFIDAEIKAPFILRPYHPHLISLSLAGKPRLIKINGHAIENIDECFWTKGLIPENERSKRYPLPWPEDPSKISSEDAIAVFRECGSECRDTINFNAGRCSKSSIKEPLVEIVEVPKLGRGVRALEKIGKGRLVGEYTGIIRSSKYAGDQIYGALMRVYNPHTNEKRYEYMVSACHRGNWTRFINHACDAPLTFRSTVIDEKHRLVIETRRDIEAFERLTLDYGDAYFLPGECKCGAKNCRFKEPAPTRHSFWAPGLDRHNNAKDSFDESTSSSESSENLEILMSESNVQAIHSRGKGVEATTEIRASVESAEMNNMKRKPSMDNCQTQSLKKRAKNL